MSEVLRIGFVSGATPDKWARHWRERRREQLELVPVTEAKQVDGVRDLSLDMALVRLPVDRDGLHCVRLYDELPVAVASRDHLLAAADEEVTTADLDDEQLVRPHASGWTPSAEQLDWPRRCRRDLRKLARLPECFLQAASRVWCECHVGHVCRPPAMMVTAGGARRKSPSAEIGTADRDG